MNYTPKQDRVLLKKIEKEKVSEGGIFLPGTAKTGNYVKGKVIGTGPGLFLNGEMRKVDITKGEVVYFDETNALSLPGSSYGEKDVYLVREFEVACGVEE